MFRLPFVAASALLIAGCASTQLNHNALDLASTVGNLVTQQILSNLSRAIDNPTGIPSQVGISAGSVTTQNSVTPSLNNPITSAITTVTSANPSRSVNDPSKVLNLSVSGQWNQSWSLDPLVDADQLRRLRALYGFAARHTDRRGLLCEYPLVEKASGRGSVGEGPARPGDAPIYVKRGCGPGGSDLEVDADPAFLKPPGCVICEGPSLPPKNGKPRKALVVNDKLRNDWLLWTGPGQSVPPGAIALGVYGNRELFVRGNKGMDAFNEFQLFVLEATAESDSLSGQGRRGRRGIITVVPGGGTILPAAPQ
jgi:hypothetical protein